MANWIPVTYALTGNKEELQDLERKIRETEEEARKICKDPDNSLEHMCDITYFAKLLGSELTYSELGGYWYFANKEYDALKWMTTDDGEEYLQWSITNKHWENPRMREMIEGSYTGIKIYYDAPSSDTNDTERRYFKWRCKLVNIDGLNYQLNDDGTACLNADDSIRVKVLHIPDHVEYDGKAYTVTGYGDLFVDPQYGSTTKPPTELEEIFFPSTIKTIASFGPRIDSLRAIHFAGDVEEIGEESFSYCNQLSIVDFGGKVGSIECYAFRNTAIRDIEIPLGTRVDPDAFNETPFEEDKRL